MAIKYPELFKPFKIGNLTIKNRIAMAPMHLGSRYAADGNITDEIIDYYEARAKGGVGLIYTGGYAVNCGVEESYNTIDPMGNVATFRATIMKLAEKLHAYDTKLFVEIGTGFGRAMFPHLMTPKMNGQPVAPSAIPNRWDPSIICRPMTDEECRESVEAQIRAGVQIYESGADGICIGGPYGGYFPDQFMTAVFNLRDDEWGYIKDYGTKCLTEVIKGIKEKCGKDFAVDVRIGSKHYVKEPGVAIYPGEEDTTPEYCRDVADSVEIAKILEAAGADSFILGNGSYDSFYWLYPPTYMKNGLWIDGAAKIKEAVNIPVICPGKINTPELANEAIRSGKIDCVAIGRAALADPDWANKARTGASEDIRPCIGCQIGCIGRCFMGENVTCAVNPANFCEKSDPVTPAAVKKHIVVIGGGVGGMETARIAAIRGHEVDLYEKSGRLGGLFNLAAVPEFKTGDDALLSWYERQMEKSSANIHLNHEVTAEEIAAMKADEIIVATGARPKMIQIPGIEDKALSATEVLNGCEAGDTAVVIGGGLVGCEVAVWLAKKGKKVTLIELLPSLMTAKTPVPTPNFLMMLDMLEHEGVAVFTGANVQSAKDGCLVFTDAEGREQTAKAESVILATGFVSDNTLYQQLTENCSVPVWNLGDSKEPANILASIRDGYFIGKSI